VSTTPQIDFSKYEQQSTPKIDFSKYETAPAAGPEDQPGFFKRGLQALGVPTSTGELVDYLKHKPADLATGGLASLAKYVVDYARDAPQAIKESNTILNDLGDRYRSGKITKEQAIKELDATHLPALRAIPFIGGNLETASKDVAAGNPSGAAGGLVGTAAPFVTGALAPKIPIARANALASKVTDTAVAVGKPAVRITRAALEDIPIVRKALPVLKESKEVPGQLKSIWNPAVPPPAPTVTPSVVPGSTLDPRSLQRMPSAMPASSGPAATSTVIPPAPVISTAERIPATVQSQPPGQYVPSGEMALNRVLTSLDNKTLLKIARSRGIDVSAEAQLRPGVANTRVIQKISDHFSPEELEALGNQAQEVFAQKPVSGDLTPQQGKDLWTYKTLKTFFPDVSMPLALEARARFAMAKRPQSSIPSMSASAQAVTPSTPIEPVIVNNASNLEELLKRTLRRR
jgi:hypothetical protein